MSEDDLRVISHRLTSLRSLLAGKKSEIDFLEKEIKRLEDQLEEALKCTSKA